MHITLLLLNSNAMFHFAFDQGVLDAQAAQRTATQADAYLCVLCKRFAR
jgi:hypothetical protein